MAWCPAVMMSAELLGGEDDRAWVTGARRMAMPPHTCDVRAGGDNEEIYNTSGAGRHKFSFDPLGTGWWISLAVPPRTRRVSIPQVSQRYRDYLLPVNLWTPISFFGNHTGRTTQLLPWWNYTVVQGAETTTTAFRCSGDGCLVIPALRSIVTFFSQVRANFFNNISSIIYHVRWYSAIIYYFVFGWWHVDSVLMQTEATETNIMDIVEFFNTSWWITKSKSMANWISPLGWQSKKNYTNRV